MKLYVDVVYSIVCWGGKWVVEFDNVCITLFINTQHHNGQDVMAW